MHKLVAQGVERSESFRFLILIVGYHPCTELKLDLLRQGMGRDAQSSFQLKGTHVEVQGQVLRQVNCVSGEITVRPLAFAREQIGHIAHELAHVLQLLEGVHPGELDTPRCWAKAYGARVVAELDAYEEPAREQEAWH